jgi:LPXTG-motif cell wall-anchored protein
MFAPPGTLVFMFLIIVGLVRNTWLIVAGVLCLAGLATAWLLRKNRAKKL